ncbi:unnamed protein product, partial [Ilex paraguariensis]
VAGYQDLFMIMGGYVAEESMLFYGFMKLVAPGIHGCIYASLVFLVCWTLAFIIAAAAADFPAGLSAGLLPAGFLAGFQLVLSLFMPFSWSSLGVLSIKVLLCCCGFDGLFFLMALFLLAAGASGSCSTLHWFNGALWFCSIGFQLDFQLVLLFLQLGFQQVFQLFFMLCAIGQFLWALSLCRSFSLFFL